MTCTHGCCSLYWKKDFTVADGCSLNRALDLQFRGSYDIIRDGLWTGGVLSSFQDLSHNWAQKGTSALSVFVSLALRCTVTRVLSPTHLLASCLFICLFLYIAMHLRPWIYNSMVWHENKDFWLPLEIWVTEDMWRFFPVWSTSTRDE